MNTRSGSAVYDGHSLGMSLLHRIDTQRLLVTSDNYATALHARNDIPEGLKQLIAELFRRGAITKCSISYGSRMELALAQTNAKGHLLLAGQKLDHFGAIFGEITGQRIAATWQASSDSSRRGGRRSSIDSSALLRALTAVVDLAIESLKIAAAIEILTND